MGRSMSTRYYIQIFRIAIMEYQVTKYAMICVTYIVIGEY